jgi:hypothetical protein
MDDTARLSAREDLVCEELDGEVIIYDPRTKLTHRLNQSAAFIFLLCDGKTSIGKIKELYRNAFGLSVDMANRDVQSVSENLIKRVIIGAGEQHA